MESGASWHQVKAILADALERPAGERAAFLAEACGGDQALMAEVASLLAAEADAGDFIETPVRAVVAPDAAADPFEGRALGAYVIERRIGDGGMGTVYLARRADQHFEQRVAIKMLRRGMDSELLVQRFRHERQILASLDHPNIARLFDGGSTAEGLPYFVMELVDGMPIDRYADEHRLSTPERLRLCLRIVEAVQHAHERQIVHRDLKPNNVLVTKDGHPKLLDFGIAKILDAGPGGPSTLTTLARPMTPDYASPEQVRGLPVTPATDVYALGLLLYELLTGHRAYRLTTHTPDEVARVVCDEEPERPSAVVARAARLTRADGTTVEVTPASVSERRDASPADLRRQLSGGLDDIVLRALRKESRFRYPTARALGDDIRRYLDRQPVAASDGAWRYAAGRFVARNRLALAAVVLVASTAAVTTTLLPGRTPADGPSPVSTPIAAPRRSVAVVAFRNLSAQPADAWLATALAEMLATELGGGGQLRVVPSNVVARALRDTDAATTHGDAAAVARLVRRAVGADVVVAGSFAVSPGDTRALRLDVQLMGDGQDAAAIAQSGTEAELFALVSATGRALRERLGVTEPSATTVRGVRAALPASVEATRLYAEGLEKQRALDGNGARVALEAAAAIEPRNPLIQLALAATWTMLGYDARATEAATRAFDASAELTREDRLTVEAALQETRRQWPAAVDVYRTLWGFFSDNIEYGLKLAAAQVAAGQGKDALVTIEGLRRLPAPQSTDPRIDLVEAQAASALGDFPRELAAAERGATRAAEGGLTQVLARARLAQGRGHYSQGRFTDALASLEEARRAFEAAGDRAGLASTISALGSVHSDLGDNALCERLYRESLALSEAIGDRRGMSAVLNNHGIVLKNQGRLDEARALHERALALRREIGDRNWTAISLNNIGVVLFEQDHMREAARYYTEAVRLSRELGDTRNVVRALHNLAIVQRETGDLAAARAGFEEAIPVREQIRDQRGAAIARVELGTVLHAQGDLEAAGRVLDEGLAAARAISFTEAEGFLLYQQAEVALTRGDLATARRLHEAALAVRTRREEPKTIGESQLALAVVALEEGRGPEAETRARAAERAASEQPAARAQALVVQGRARLAAGDVAGARRLTRAARALVTSTDRIWVQFTLATAEARVALAAGDVAAARAQVAAIEALLRPTGMALAQLETRLLAAETARLAGAASAAGDLRQVAEQARAMGAGLVRTRALALGAVAS